MEMNYKYKHALCLYPYFSGDKGTGVDFFPPTGLEYIATALKGHVGKISLIDLRHRRSLESPKKMFEFISKNVDLVCISVGWRSQYEKACNYIKSLPPDRTIVVGGREATDQVEDLFERCANVDVVVRGEGEQTIQELADGMPLEKILGLSYRCNGSIIHNPNRPLQPIDNIEPPDRSLRQNSYFPKVHGIKLLPKEFDTILGSRGCPYKCKFCTFSLNPLGQKRDYVARTPESVVDEIEASKGQMIIFADDNFFVNAARAERICDLIIERGIKKLYFANARIEVSKHPELLEKAYRAGFRVLLMGIESASDRTLEQLNKGFNTKQIREAFAVFRKFPFFYHAYFIYGNVGETEQEMLAIPKFARDLGVHMINLSSLRVDKFTPLRKLIEETPGYRISAKGSVYSKQYDRRRLKKIRKQIRNDFFFNREQFFRIFNTVHDSGLLTYWEMCKVGIASLLLLFSYIFGSIAKHFRGSYSKVSN
ncbi:MAG: hypothetical protein A2Y12_19550 [Planctomycetes bacterium GWF2_42_9]|nr:MAG: hypothetical protein A2Y12_19550 [Planctomycetes bacterium GWF2_42_9]